jgi:amidase
VRDLAALLSTQAGHDPRAPLSLADGPRRYVPGPRESTVRGARIGWLADLDGHLAMEPGILEVCEAALRAMSADGARVEPAALGFDPDALWHAWLRWRRALVGPNVGAAIATPEARAQVKPEALWECDQAAGLTFNDFMQAAAVRSAFHDHLLGLFEHFDVLALPVAQVWPFDLALDWPKAIAGRAMDTYHRWMEVTLYATFAGLPAISVPAGFDPAGRLPMGLQLVGRPQGDAELLRIAAGYEALVPELLARRPHEDPR